LDIVFAELTANGGEWSYEIREADCYAYTPEWKEKLSSAVNLNARDYLLLHTDYGHYLGQEVNRFIREKGIEFQVGLIASHGHTSFHLPAKGMTAQLGDGAAIAAETGLPVVTDLRSVDLAFGGQGAPIVPIGEQLLFRDHDLFLNLGGIANLSLVKDGNFIAFDVGAANRVLNMLAAQAGKDYDEGGNLAASGKPDPSLLATLNALPYFSLPYPKSLANSFGTDEVYPLILQAGLSIPDALCSFTEHIATQVGEAVKKYAEPGPHKMLVTGGGAFNHFLIQRLKDILSGLGVEVTVPEEKLVNYKEALVMALIGVLRWRQEYNVMASVTGARRNSIGGAVWIGQEA
jgi:anhydro-N-acetylmuramic acid kinase